MNLSDLDAEVTEIMIDGVFIYVTERAAREGVVFFAKRTGRDA